MSAWLTVDDVKTYAGITPADTADDAAIRWATDATMAYVETLPVWSTPRVAQPIAGGDGPPADVFEGSLMLASRWYKRRNSPEGLATFADVGGVSIPPLDRDIERLLRIGKFAPPRVG